LIGACQKDVLYVWAHGARPGPVAGGGAVHDGEDAGMNLLLYGQQID